MFKIIESSSIDMTPNKAKEWWKLNDYEGQRNFDLKNAKKLAHEMKNGRFTTGNISIAILVYDNYRSVMTNGQHQTWACINTSLQQKVSYNLYECYCKKDLEELFSTFNVDKNRSQQNLMKAKLLTLELKWPLQLSSSLVSAYDNINKFNMYKPRTQSLTKYEKVQLLDKCIEPGEKIVKMFNTYKGTRSFSTVNVLIAMIITYNVSKSNFDDFWYAVVSGMDRANKGNGTALMNGDSRLIARSIILNKTTSGNSSQNELMAKQEFIGRLILCWNKWRRNEPLYKNPPFKKFIKCNDGKEVKYFPKAI